MRFKYWAFLILLAVDLIFQFLASYLAKKDWALGYACFGVGIVLSISLFLMIVDIRVGVMKRRFYKSPETELPSVRPLGLGLGLNFNRLLRIVELCEKK